MIITTNESLSKYEYKLITQLFKTALGFSGAKYKKVSADINFTAPAEIKRLNREFRKIDSVTDVLSFPSLTLMPHEKIRKKEHRNDIDKASKHLHLGDIAICRAVVKKQAEELGHSEQREECYLLVHGFLHLLGFDHQTDEEKLIMRGLEEEILKKYHIDRNKA